MRYLPCPLTNYLYLHPYLSYRHLADCQLAPLLTTSAPTLLASWQVACPSSLPGANRSWALTVLRSSRTVRVQ